MMESTLQCIDCDHYTGFGGVHCAYCKDKSGWTPKAKTADCGINLADIKEDYIEPYQPPKFTPPPMPECKPAKSDPVQHPNHYCKGGMECIDAIRAAVTGLTGFEAYCTGNILKYIWRWHDKNGAEDLRKAKQYIDFLIEEVSK